MRNYVISGFKEFCDTCAMGHLSREIVPPYVDIIDFYGAYPCKGSTFNSYPQEKTVFLNHENKNQMY
jgi:hypothetical protein